MARKHILHMLTPLKHMSPFDVNMALDAGFDAVVPYVGVHLAEVTGLVQDAIFSRPPDAGVDTGIFIAGKDVVAGARHVRRRQEGDGAALPGFRSSPIRPDPSPRPRRWSPRSRRRWRRSSSAA